MMIFKEPCANLLRSVAASESDRSDQSTAVDSNGSPPSPINQNSEGADSKDFADIIRRGVELWVIENARYPLLVSLLTLDPDRAIVLSGERLASTCPALLDHLKQMRAEGKTAVVVTGSMGTWDDLLEATAPLRDPLPRYSLSRSKAALLLGSKYGCMVQMDVLVMMALNQFFDDPVGVKDIVHRWGRGDIKKMVDRLGSWESLLSPDKADYSAKPDMLLEHYTDALLNKFQNGARTRLKELVAIMTAQHIESCTHDRCWWNDSKETHLVDKDPAKDDGTYRSAAVIRWDQAIKLVQHYVDFEGEVPTAAFALKECEMEAFRYDSCHACKPEIKVLFRLVPALAKQQEVL